MALAAGRGPRAADGGGREGVTVAGQFSWVPDGVDTQKANVARVYDYWLGGTHNFRADQDAARALIAVEPTMRDMARANRDFLGRAVRFLAASGIRQFLDIGSGIPTERNVHEVAQQAAPGVRVMYVRTSIPVAVAHSKKILARRGDTRCHPGRSAGPRADPRSPRDAADDRLQPARRVVAGGGLARDPGLRGAAAERGHVAGGPGAGQLPGDLPCHQ